MIIFSCPECSSVIGIIIKVYEDGKYLVQELNPQTSVATRFVFASQIIETLW